jgi:predicted membrane-bound spermidine synthase
VNQLPFDFFELNWNKSKIFYILLYYFLLNIPFFFAGLIISFAISRISSEVTKIYFSDLTGAGIGSLLILLIFMPRGDRGAILIIFSFAILSNLFFALRWNKKGLFAIPVFLFLTAVSLFIYSPPWLAVKISPYKALPLALKYPGARHLLIKWDSISRIDVIDSPVVRFAPGMSLIYLERIPTQLGISIDGGELNAITEFRNKIEKSEFIDYLPTSLAYKLSPKNKILLINPKGGLEILVALKNGARNIVCLESTPLIIKLLKNEYKEFSGYLYDRENIRVHSTFTRSFIKSTKDKYDLITICQTDVLGASSTGWQGIAENYLFTVESFKELISLLTEEGILNITSYLIPPPRGEIRLVNLIVQAFEELGIKNISQHIVIFRSWGTITYLIKKDEFTYQELSKIKDFCKSRMFDLVFYHGIKPEELNQFNKFKEPVYYNLIKELFEPKKRKTLEKSYLFDIKPTYDDNPFFFNFFKFSKIKSTYLSFGKKWPPLLQGGYLLLIILIQAILIGFIMIILPVILKRRNKSITQNKSRKLRWIVFFYFALLGITYMFIEITFIQKLILFLGHPSYSMSAVIFSFLLSSGFGSYFSRKILPVFDRTNMKKFLIILIILGGLSIFQFYLSDIIFKLFSGSNLPIKFIISFLFIFPLGFLMGIPFPSGIRILSSREESLIPWAWAVNSFSSVINSVNAQFIALLLGYSSVIVFAGIGYIIAGFILFLSFGYFSNHRNKSHTHNVFNL